MRLIFDFREAKWQLACCLTVNARSDNEALEGFYGLFRYQGQGELAQKDCDQCLQSLAFSYKLKLTEQRPLP